MNDITPFLRKLFPNPKLVDKLDSMIKTFPYLNKFVL